MSSPKAESPVRALSEQLMDGWNQGNVEAFAAPFAEDADFVHQPLFDKRLQGTRLTGEVSSIRFLSTELAIMHAVGRTTMRNQSKSAPERDSLQTLVAAKRNAEWHLVAFHNTRVRPIGRSAGGTFVWLAFDWLWKLFRPPHYSANPSTPSRRE